MVYPMEHVLLRFNGFFGNAPGADSWSTGIRFGLAGSAPTYDAAKMQTFVNAAKTAASTFHAAAGTVAGSNCYLRDVTGARIGVLGTYQPTTQQTAISPTTPVAGTGGPIHSWNTAMVLSLRTSIPRGRGSNGRVYWPCLAVTVDSSTGRIGTGVVTPRVNAFKTFLDALNVAADAYYSGMRAIVASNVGGGSHTVVTHVRSDDRLDSIERRENNQPPVWTTATLA